MSIFDAFSGSAGRRQAMDNQARLDAIQGQALGALGTGFDTAKQYYGQANQLYQPLTDQFSKGVTLNADALGLNGPEGTARARAAYSTSPGYQFALDQGLGTLDRRAASRGALGGGGTGADEMGYAIGTANQDYGNWLQRISQYNPLAMSATGAQAGNFGTLGNLGYNLGQSQAGVYQGIGQQGIQNANMGYQAGQQALANDWNAIFGGAQLAASLLGGGYGGSGGTGGGSGPSIASQFGKFLFGGGKAA